jgi:ribonucleotide reductase alpha subunit
MNVINRNKEVKEVKYINILKRIKKACKYANIPEDSVDIVNLALKVSNNVIDMITTSELDNVTVGLCMNLSTDNPYYKKLGGMIAISNHQKQCVSTFDECVDQLMLMKHEDGELCEVLNKQTFNAAKKYKKEIQDIIKPERDFLFDYFGFKTLERAYMIKHLTLKIPVETPQYMWMRVALGIHGEDFENVKNTYELLSTKMFTHATPTLFNSGTNGANFISCFAGHTLVDTTRGPCEISKILMGDKVITHTGKIRTVSQVHVNELNGRIVRELKVWGTRIVEVTANHKMWAIKGNDTVPGWVEVENLTENDFVSMPNNISKLADSNNMYTNKEKVLKRIRELTKENVNLEFENEIELSKTYTMCRNAGIPVKYVDKTTLNFDTPPKEFVRNIDVNGNIFSFLKVISNTESNNTFPLVYNIGVEEDNSYSICGLIAKNCFLLGTGDSIEELYKTVSDCAKISKYSGGIGIHIGEMRSSGSIVKGTNGVSNGIKQYLKVLNDTAKHVNQGGKRPGSIALYMSLWHPDIADFLEVGRNHGIEEDKSRDLFYGLWVPDLFMKQVKNCGDWYLINPVIGRELLKLYGDEFETRYYQLVEKYKDGRYVVKINALDLWNHILTVQKETGMPYMLYKDNVNNKSPQKNIGTIRSSNLCVAPETRILTQKGYYEIKSLKNKKVNVWNGEQWSATTVRQTNEYQPLITVGLSDGTVIDCTVYHKFYLSGLTEPVEAKKLKIGMELIEFDIEEVTDSGDIYRGAYNAGFKSGANSTNRKKTRRDRHDDKKIGHTYDRPAHIFAPINTGKKSKLQWLEGFFDCDGKIVNEEPEPGLTVESEFDDFIINIKLMLQTLGVKSIVSENNTMYTLTIDSYYTNRLLTLGFSPRILDIKISPSGAGIELKHTPILVTSVKNNSRSSPTYCFKEPVRGMGTFEGVVTGNCSEIVLYSDTEEYACCNLVSLRLHSFLRKPDLRNVVIYGKAGCIFCKLSKAYLHSLGIEYNYVSLDDETVCKMFYDKFKVSSVPQIFIDNELIGGFEELKNKVKYSFDWKSFRLSVHTAVENLNKIIDINKYPVPEAKLSNMKHRPIGIGVQGLANVFEQMWLEYQSEEAIQINKEIFARMYYYALEKSMQLAKKDGKYSTFEGSPASKGILQYHMWGVEPLDVEGLDWKWIEGEVMKHGLRNSTLIALMPTASTAQILGSNSSFEAFTSNVYTRSTMAGEFIVVNDMLINILIDIGMWNETMKHRIMHYRGNISNIDGIPQIVKNIYKTSYDMSNKVMIDMAADRGAYICQTQSHNIFESDPSFSKLTKIHFYGWKKGLKTGMYYLRTKPASNSQSFTVDPLMAEMFESERLSSSRTEEDCLMCGS